jgi:hypothetical protein
VRPGLRGNLLLSLGVTLALMALLEAGARIVEKRRPPRPQVADYIWNWDDKMPGGFYVVNVDAVGWPPWEVYNGDGLRDRTRTHEKPAGVTRIAFLGDSVTLGAMILPAEAYPQRLEARYASEGRRAEVMSVALWGWSTRQERIAWHRIARHYRRSAAGHRRPQRRCERRRARGTRAHRRAARLGSPPVALADQAPVAK